MNPTSKAIREISAKRRGEHTPYATMTSADIFDVLDEVATAIDEANGEPADVADEDIHASSFVAPAEVRSVSADILDPFFMDEASDRLLRSMCAIQDAARSDRPSITRSTNRRAACSRLLSEGHSSADIQSAWRWFLTTDTIEDQFRGNWIDTFLKGFDSYLDRSRATPASPDAAKFTLPKAADWAGK